MEVELSKIFEAFMSVVSVAIIGLVLWHTSGSGTDSPVVLDRPGAVSEVSGERTKVVAYYRRAHGEMKVNIQFFKADGSTTLFRTSFGIVDKQRHAVQVGDDDNEDRGERYIFRRLGDKIEITVQRDVMV